MAEFAKSLECPNIQAKKHKQMTVARSHNSPPNSLQNKSVLANHAKQASHTVRHEPDGCCVSSDCEDIPQDLSAHVQTSHVASNYMPDLASPGALSQLDCESRHRSSSLSSVDLKPDNTDQQYNCPLRNRSATLGASSLSVHNKNSRLLQVRQERPLRRRAAQVISPLARTPLTDPENKATMTSNVLNNELLVKAASDTCLAEQACSCQNSIRSDKTPKCEDGFHSTFHQQIGNTKTPDNTIENETACPRNNPSFNLCTSPYPTKLKELNKSKGEKSSSDSPSKSSLSSTEATETKPCVAASDIMHKLHCRQSTNGGDKCNKEMDKSLSSYHIGDDFNKTEVFDEWHEPNSLATYRPEKLTDSHTPVSQEQTNFVRPKKAHCLETQISDPVSSRSATASASGRVETNSRSSYCPACPADSEVETTEMVCLSQLSQLSHDLTTPADTRHTTQQNSNHSTQEQVFPLPRPVLSGKSESIEVVNSGADGHDSNQGRNRGRAQQFHLTSSEPCVHRETEAGSLEQKHVYQPLSIFLSVWLFNLTTFPTRFLHSPDDLTTGVISTLVQVYRKIAPQCDHVRHKAWPRVSRFLKDLHPGSLVADIGCGSGRYLGVNNHIVKFGSDICSTFLEKARSQGFEVAVADNFALPFRDASFDAVISIGVIHHFASLERRVKALEELSRILSPGGKLMIYVWAFEQTHRKFDSQDVLIPWVRPDGTGLPRRNTVCCLSDQDVNVQSSVFPSDSGRGTGQLDTSQRSGSVLTSSSHRSRRRSRSVGDNPESETREVGTPQAKPRLFGVFDKRAGSSLVSAMSLPLSRGFQDAGKSIPLEKPQLAKLPSQLVSECRKLGRFLRSLSSKSFSSSCEEAIDTEHNTTIEHDVFIDKPVTGNISLSAESKDVDMESLMLDGNGNCAETETVEINSNDVSTKSCSSSDYKNENNEAANEQTISSDVCVPDTLCHVMSNNIQHLQNTIMLENINSANNEPSNGCVCAEYNANKEVKENPIPNLNLQVPVIRENGVMNRGSISPDKPTGINATDRYKLALMNENDGLNNGYTDGYATDIEYSPYGSRTPIGLCRTPEYLDPSSPNCSGPCFVPPHCTHPSIKTTEKGCRRGSDNHDDDLLESELKHLEKPKSYLQVLTPVLISSSADESDGMSPGNLSPCSWYTAGGGTSGESDGPGSIPTTQRLNVIALDRVCFGQSHTDGREQLHKWVESQQARNFESSNEDLLSPQYSGRPFRNKQSNMASRKRNLPHIQVHTLRESDMKSYGSDPNLPDAPKSPLFLVSADQDNSRARAFSDVSTTDNARSCRYSDSVFSDTLRTPSIATPGLRTPSSGGGPSDYNTSTEVLFAPSDLAENNDCFCDTDSVFTPDHDRTRMPVYMAIKERHFHTDVNRRNTERNSEVNYVDGCSQLCLSLKKQRKRKSSPSDKESQHLSSSDLDSLESPGSYQTTAQEKSTQSGGHNKRKSNPVKAMFYKIVQIFSPLPQDDIDQLLSDTESHHTELPENEDVVTEERLSDDTTTSTSLTLSLVSPLKSPGENQIDGNHKDSSGLFNRDDSYLETDCCSTDKKTFIIPQTLWAPGDVEKHCVSMSSQNHLKPNTVKGVSNKVTGPNPPKTCCVEGSILSVDKDNMREKEKSRLRTDFIHSLIVKWSHLFGNVTSSDPKRDNVDPPAIDSSIEPTNILNSNLTGAKRPETLDFSRKRSRLRNQRKLSMEKNTFNKRGILPVTRKLKPAVKPAVERKLTLAAAFNLLSEGASEDSFAHRLDESASAVFTEMRRLNFAVREFPRSSMKGLDSHAIAKEKSMETREMNSVEQKYLIPSKDTPTQSLPNSSQEPAAGDEAIDVIGEAQLVKSVGRKVKSFGSRRRFSDSSANQRSRRNHGMIHLKPPNWTFGYSLDQDVVKTDNLFNGQPFNGNKSTDGTNEKHQTAQKEEKSKKTDTKNSLQCQGHTGKEKHGQESETLAGFNIKHQDRGKISESARCCTRSEEQPVDNVEKSEVPSSNNVIQNKELSHRPNPPSPTPHLNQNKPFTNVTAKHRNIQVDVEMKLPTAPDKHLSQKNTNTDGQSDAEPHEVYSSVDEGATQLHHQPLLNQSKPDSEFNKLTEYKQPGCVDKSLSRYYHVFKQGELDSLIKDFVPALGVIDAFYDHSNWCIVAQKK